MGLEYYNGLNWDNIASEVFVNKKLDDYFLNPYLIDINNNTSGQLNIARINGYPSNPNLFLRGDGTWNSPITPIIDINNGTSSQLDINRLKNYPNDSSLFLCGNGNWVTPSAIISLPLTLYSSSISNGIKLINQNINAYATDFSVSNIEKDIGIQFGLNTSTSEGYVWANNNTSIKFGTNNTPRMQIYANGGIDFFSNNLNTNGVITAENFYSNNTVNAFNIFASNSLIGNVLASYNLPYIQINSPVNNLTLYSDLKLNGNRITDSSGLHSMSFVGGTLEVSSGITTGRYYSYGWLNSGGSTGTSSGTNYYSIVCQDRIAASEFNATSSKKIKKIIPNLDIEDLKRKFLNLNFYQYNYIDNSDGQGDHYGVIAEDLNLIFPQFVDMQRERYVPNCVDEKGKMKTLYFSNKENEIYKFNHKIDFSKIGKESKFVRLFVNNVFYKACIVDITAKKLYLHFEEKDKTVIDKYLKTQSIVYIYGTYEKCPTVEKNKLFEIGLILLQELLKKLNKRKI